MYPKDVLEGCTFAKMLVHRLMHQFGMLLEALIEAALSLANISLSASWAFDTVDDPILLGVWYPVFHAAEFSDFAGCE